MSEEGKQCVPHIMRVTPLQLQFWWARFVEPPLRRMGGMFLPGHEEEAIQHLCVSIIRGKANLWLGFDIGGEQPVLLAGMITTVIMDPMSGARSLLMYALWSYHRHLPMELMKLGMQCLKDYAKGAHCHHISALTHSKAMDKYVEEFKLFSKKESYWTVEV